MLSVSISCWLNVTDKNVMENRHTARYNSPLCSGIDLPAQTITFGIKLTHVMLKGHIVYRSKKDMAIGWENLLYGLE